MSDIYIPPIPAIGDKRYSNLPHKELLDPLRIIHYDRYGKDPSIQQLKGEDKYLTMFRNGRFLPTATYKVREGMTSYIIQFSWLRNTNFAGSILITGDVKQPFNDDFSYLDDDYIDSLTGYVTNICNGDVNLILSNSTFTELSFGHITINNHNGEYLNFIDCAAEQLRPVASERNIIYVGEDLQQGFTPDEIRNGDELIERARADIIEHSNISDRQILDFNEQAKRRILRP